jgi:hypothetical protein
MTSLPSKKRLEAGGIEDTGSRLRTKYGRYKEITE